MKRSAAAILGALLAVGVQAAPPVAKRIGLLGWPSDPEKPMHALSSELEECLTRTIRDEAPEIVILPQRAIRDALFPLMEPSTEPANEEAFGALLAREDVRERLAKRRLDYLVAFAGGTRTEPFKGGILCGAGYGGGGCLGFAWQSESTSLAAALWTIEGTQPSGRESAEVQGTTAVPAFVLPIPFFAQTHWQACAELGHRVAAAIRRGGSAGAK